ncbi:MAG: hypothetical protein HRT45_11220 [Bdellovibrionales bacterium]|nr:hypothetical protein [Bdellovibrionales bacterium]
MSNSTSHNSFCAYCKTPRKVYLKRHITATNVWLSFLVSLLFMFVVWEQFDPRMLFVFVVALSCAEVFVQVRWRMGLRCQHCGFDPVVYMKSPKRAAQLVRDQFDRRSQNLEFLFTDSPLLREAAMAHFQSQARRSASTDLADSEVSPGLEGSQSSVKPPQVGSGGTIDSLPSDLGMLTGDEVVDEGLTRT